MELQIAQNTTIENENLLVFGGVGSGKSRYFITPFITSVVDSEFILLSANNDIEELDNAVAYPAVYCAEKVIRNKITLLRYPMSTNRDNAFIVRNIKDLLELLTPEKPIYVIFDGYGMFDFNFTKEYIENLNNKGIYCIFVLQTAYQLNENNKFLFDFCKKHLLMSNPEKDLYKTTYKNMEFNECYIYSDKKLKLDLKLDPINSTKLKYFRIKKGLSQTELSEISGVNLRNIRAIEKDISKIQKLQALNLYKIASALDCTMEDLLEL